MQIQTQIDILPLVQQTTRSQKNLAYSTAQGINETAKQIQAEQRRQLAQHFELRTPQTRAFLERQVAIIKPFASVPAGRLFAEVAVGERKKLLLSSYEKGEERKPVKGKLIAQPVTGNAARPTFASPVAQAYTFKAMALKAKRTQTGDLRYAGRNGTYTIANVGVFIRSGKSAELLYAYAKEQKLPAKLHWELTAKRVAGRWLSENITRAFLKTLRP